MSYPDPTGIVCCSQSVYFSSMAMRTSINWGVFLIFGVLILGFIIAGFFVSPDAKTDDGHPLNYFFWGMAGMFLLTNGAVILWAVLSNRRRATREETWMDGTAEILEVGETGTYINNQPRLRFRLLVNSPVHGTTEVVMKRVIPLTALAQYQQGTTIQVKVNPEDAEEVMIL
jgi:hypothetical protein